MDDVTQQNAGTLVSKLPPQQRHGRSRRRNWRRWLPHSNWANRAAGVRPTLAARNMPALAA